MHAIVSHSNKNALTAELQSNSPHVPFSEETKHMVHTQGKIEDFELCRISKKSMSSLYEILVGRTCVVI